MSRKVSAIADAETLVVAAPVDGATLVRLAGITAAAGVEADAVATAARRMVADLTVERFVCVDMEQGGGADRYGRLPAQVRSDDGQWLQGRLLAEGLARVRPEAQARRRIAEMLAIEEEARLGRRGLWQVSAYRVRSSEDVERAVPPPGLQIVEGRVLQAERRGDWWYLNFGANWRSDFTVMIGKQALPEFARAGLAPVSLEGRTIRVRGMLQRYNGPMIDVLLPEQIEVIDAAGG
jgi:endonuclease YncB( thermonuclease family)